MKDISADFSDGVLDGKSASAALESTLTITPEQALVGLNTAISNFLNSPMNKSTYASVSVSTGTTEPPAAGQ